MERTGQFAGIRALSFIGSGQEGLALARDFPGTRVEVFVASWDDVDATREEASRRGLDGHVRVHHAGAAGVLERRRGSRGAIPHGSIAPRGAGMRRFQSNRERSRT